MVSGSSVEVAIPSVLLVGPAFSGGGAEGRFTNIGKRLFGGRNDVAVLSAAESVAHPIGGEVVDLGWSGRFSYPKLVWRLARRLRSRNYDLIMSFGLFPSVISIFAVMFSGRKIKLVVSEITRPKLEATLGRGKIYNFLRRKLYPRSTLITANSIDGLRETCELAGVPVEDGIRVVNAIDVSRLDSLSAEEPGIEIPKRKFIICVARLEFMKRVDTIIDAFAGLADKLECDLVIVGDGEALSELEQQVERLGLLNRVLLTGRVENPFPVLARAAVFVLSSEYEGFSNSVLEAMFCDVPVITSFCTSDAYDMCDQDAALGFEVGNCEQLKDCIAAVISDKNLHDELVQGARAYRTPHAMENAIPLYEDLICKVVASTGET